MILGVINYSLGLTTPSQSNKLKPDRVQNEVTKIIVETTKGTAVSPWTCHKQNLDTRWSKPKLARLPCRILTIHSTLLSVKKGM